MSAPPAPYSETPTPDRGAPEVRPTAPRPAAAPGGPGPEPAAARSGEPGPPGAADAPADPVAPADLAPAPTWRERLAWYAGSVALALVLATCGMQLWNRDLHAPFYYDLDALLYLPLVKTTLEHASHWRTERLGAPGQQELYDFPIIDHLHLALLWLIGRITPDLLLVYNIYSLLTYPLTALTAMWVMRWLKLSLPAAALGGLLYTFLPYHQERYQYHYFLAAYWWVPVSLVPALALCKGEFPFFPRRSDGTFAPLEIDWGTVWAAAKAAARGSAAAWGAVCAWVGRAARTVLGELFTLGALGQIALGAVTASAGAYYAFFACVTYAVAGVYAWVVHRTWRGAVSAALVIAPVVAVGVALHMPAFLYQGEYGVNPLTRRYPEEADSYGLKIAHLLLPANDHNFRPFANLRSAFSNAPNRPAETERAGSLGAIGGVGLLALLVMAVLPIRRRWPMGPLVALTLSLVLLTTIGAFGSLFNFLISPQIRAYNRIGVFIGFLSLLAVLWWVDRFLLTRTGRFLRQARYPVLGALLLIGYFDQTPWGWNPLNPNGMAAIDAFAERFRADKQFFKRIEDAMPPGASVFCLPYVGFPESPAVQKMGAYEHARGYVMTDTLFWSYGAIKGREADVWQRDVAATPVRHAETMLKRIVARGFDGLLVDARGYPVLSGVNQATALIQAIHHTFAAAVGRNGVRLPEIVHEDGKQFFLDLRPFRDVWREKEPAEFAARERYEREWVAPLWLDGFFAADPLEDGGERVFWGPFDANLVLLNPTDRTRTFDLSFTIGVEVAGPFDLTLSGLVTDAFSLDKIHDRDDPQDLKRHGEQKEYKGLELPPGRSRIHIRCRPPIYFLPFDRRNLCYFVANFKLTERGK